MHTFRENCPEPTYISPKSSERLTKTRLNRDSGRNATIAEDPERLLPAGLSRETNRLCLIAFLQTAFPHRNFGYATQHKTLEQIPPF